VAGDGRGRGRCVDHCAEGGTIRDVVNVDGNWWTLSSKGTRYRGYLLNCSEETLAKLSAQLQSAREGVCQHKTESHETDNQGDDGR